MSTKQLYYVERYAGGQVGNSMLWWKFDNCGYICDIRKAKKFKKSDLPNSPEKYRIWPCEYIEELVSHHIDIQSVDFDISVEGDEG